MASVYVDVAVACPGERYSAAKLAAAHRTLPCGSFAEVVNQRNGRRIVVRIVDRGPFIKGRIIDLTPAAARELALGGLGPVRVTQFRPERPAGEPFVTFEDLWSLRIGPAL